MKLAKSGLNNRSASTTDCFLEPVKAGYVRPDVGSLSASTNLSKLRRSGPPSLV